MRLLHCHRHYQQQQLPSRHRCLHSAGLRGTVARHRTWTRYALLGNTDADILLYMSDNM